MLTDSCVDKCCIKNSEYCEEIKWKVSVRSFYHGHWQTVDEQV